MAPVFGLGLGLVLTWLSIVAKVVSVFFILVGLALFWSHNKGGFRSWRLAGVLSVCAGAAMLFWLSRAFASVPDQASDVMKLPKEATVLQFKVGDLAGDGSVVFKLPSNHSVRFWLDTVWKMNGQNKGSFSSATDREEFGEKGNINLSYDQASQTYSYESES